MTEPQMTEQEKMDVKVQRQQMAALNRMYRQRAKAMAKSRARKASPR